MEREWLTALRKAKCLSPEELTQTRSNHQIEKILVNIKALIPKNYC